MIVSGSSLHLYCDCAACLATEGKVASMEQPGAQSRLFTGETRQDCWRTAHLAGWTRHNARCWAPGHTRRPDDTPDL